MAKAKKKAAPKKSSKKKPAAPKKMGRPSSFSERLVLRILELAKAGKTDAQIAADVGISTSTLNNWKAAHPDFLVALKDAKAVADELVEAALFQRAVGYRNPAVKFFFDSKEGKIHSQPYIETTPPDTTACIFWLKNRQPDRWRDTSRHELTGKDGKDLEGPKVVITLPSNGREAQ